MSPQEREAAVEERKKRGYPWHRPPHPETARQHRIITASCFEHQVNLNSPTRLKWFEDELLETIRATQCPCSAWCVLPNHYHFLALIEDFKSFSIEIGKLHGRTSHEMNKEDECQGRTVWFRSFDRCMRLEAHFFTTLNYIHHNPVKHGYVEKWQDWPFSSVHWYLQTKGRDWLLENWQKYPLKDYGKGWDD